jgi:tetratricopeptide (TPR) repeat protein
LSQGHGFFYELQRRHVVRVAIAYAVAGWVVLQLASIVFPAFGAPEWVLKVVIALLAFGFLLALVLAWAFELTPVGIRRTEPAHSPEARTPEEHRSVGRSLNTIVIGVLAVAVGVLLWRQFGTQAAGDSKPGAASGKSIAVLPFESLSEDKANAYFATGRQDEILTRLSGIRDLKVISRTSTAQYASHPTDLKTVGLQLGVAAVLEGSVQKAGEAARVASVPTQDPEAFDLYLRALAFSNRANDQYGLTLALMPQAITLLEQAIAKDPNFALASALLGRAHMYMFFFGADRNEARLVAAKKAADESLRLQPDLGPGHFALAFYWYWGFREYVRAQAELDLARKVMPQNYDVEEIYAAIARRQGTGSRRWKDCARRRATIRAIRAPPSNSARPTRCCAVTPMRTRPTRTRRS